MARKKIETIIKDKIAPYTLTDKGKANISKLVRQYSYELLLECIDIGVSTYFNYDQNGNLKRESVENFLDKLGGIAYNKSRSPIDQEIYHLKNMGKRQFSYWNPSKADELLNEYVKELRLFGWPESLVLSDLRDDSVRMMNNSRNWSDWSSTMEQWIKDVRSWSEKDSMEVEQSGSVLPDALFNKLPQNVQSLCKQINASYEKNLFDCTAVMMRRLLESLLVLSYQRTGIEAEITDKSGMHHVSLDKMIKNAEQNATLSRLLASHMT